MIEFITEGPKTRKYDIIINGEEIVKLELKYTPIVNKFHEITKFIEDASIKLGNDFDIWLTNLLTDYINTNYDHSVIFGNVDKIKLYTDRYLEILDVDYSQFVNKSKKSKNSIFFDVIEIENLIKASYYLKIYSLFTQDIHMQPADVYYKEIYNILIKDIKTQDILTKVFNLVSSKINKSQKTDASMWEYVKLTLCKTTDIHMLHIFNWINHNILVLCDAHQNPISFMTSVANESINWILRNVYRESLIWSETVNTEDANFVPGKDRLESYAYNDTIAKVLVLAYDCLARENIKESTFKENIQEQKQTSTVARYITFPMLSKALDIPYKHLLTIPSEHSYLLNILLYNFLDIKFKEKYPEITDLILRYNVGKEVKKTTYKLKNNELFMNTFNSFLNCKNRMYAVDFYSNIIGKLYRNDYKHFKNSVRTIHIHKLEKDLISLYNKYFNDDMDDELKALGISINNAL